MLLIPILIFLITSTNPLPCPTHAYNNLQCNICYSFSSTTLFVDSCHLNIPQQQSYDIQHCIFVCCQKSQISTQRQLMSCGIQHNQIKKLQQENQEQADLLPIVLPVAAVFAVMIIILIIGIYKRNGCFCSCAGPCGDCLKFCGYLLTCGCIRQKFNKKTEERPEIIIREPETHQQTENRIYEQPRKTGKLSWQKIGKNFIPPKQEPCSICLSPKTNCLTQCGHLFHVGCLWQWASRNQHCPNCMSNNVEPIFYYCLKCKKRYAEIDLNKTNKWKNFTEFLNASQQFCHKCS